MDQSKMKELTKELVSFKTTEGNKKEISNCLEHIEEYFIDTGLEVRRFEKDNVPSLFISSNKQDLQPRILLHGHIDVVEADEEMFEPCEKDGKLYGRGTADMKGGVAVLMKLMKDLEPANTSLLITSDEEVGGFNGTGYLVEEKGLEPEFVISAEPCEKGDFPTIVNQHKGVYQVRLSASGESCHASKPENGVNAIDKIIEEYQKFKTVFAKSEIETTLNLGKIEGGESLNQVPEKVFMELDIRFNDTLKPRSIEERLEELDVNYEVIAEAPMMYTSQDNRYVERLKTCIAEDSSNYFGSQDFASDARFFTEKGIPAVLFGPEGENIHGEQEHVEIKTLKKFYNYLESFVEKGD